MSPWHWALALLALAVLAFALSLRLQKLGGLPPGKIVAADSSLFQRLPAPLLDTELGLVGKPDYILNASGGGCLPVEYKNSLAPAQPYPGHQLQLAAYLRLIEAQEGQRPPHGLIRYRDRSFELPYTPALEARLRQALAAMRAMEAGQVLPNRSHQQASRCRACGFREICDQALR